MPYIGRDGTVGGQEQKSVRRKITDFFAGIFNFIALFFSAITNPPSIESRGNYAQRNNNNPYRVSGGGGRTLGQGGGGGSNIRGVKNLQGAASAKMGG